MKIRILSNKSTLLTVRSLVKHEFENKYAHVTRDQIYCCFLPLYCNTDLVLYKDNWKFNICAKYNTKSADYYSISALYQIEMILYNAKNSHTAAKYTCTAPFSLITVRNWYIDMKTIHSDITSPLIDNIQCLIVFQTNTVYKLNSVLWQNGSVYYQLHFISYQLHILRWKVNLLN